MFKYLFYTMFFIATIFNCHVAKAQDIKPEVNCSSKEIQKIVKQKISDFYEKHPPTNLYKERIKKLSMKSVKRLENFNPLSFSNEDILVLNYQKEKFSKQKNIKKEEIKLCQTQWRKNKFIVVIVTKNKTSLIGRITGYGGKKYNFDDYIEFSTKE